MTRSEGAWHRLGCLEQRDPRPPACSACDDFNDTARQGTHRAAAALLHEQAQEEPASAPSSANFADDEQRPGTDDCVAAAYTSWRSVTAAQRQAIAHTQRHDSTFKPHQLNTTAAHRCTARQQSCETGCNCNMMIDMCAHRRHAEARAAADHTTGDDAQGCSQA